MFTYSTSIRLADTDAMGVLYFIHQFRLAQEVFEEHLEREGFSLKRMLAEAEYLLPIVHADGDYLAPLYVGDRLEIQMRVSELGTSSFTLGYRFLREGTGEEVGRASIVHVAVSKKTKTSVPLPEELRDLLGRDLNSR